MRLYHYTSKKHFWEILMSSCIKRTASHLHEPVNLHYDASKNAYIADNDDEKPVVWLTSSPAATSDALGSPKLTQAQIDKLILRGIAPAGFTVDMADWKDSVRIAVEKTDDMVKWKKWVEENDGDPAYMRALKKTAADNKNWYVCEREISVSEIVDIEVNGKPFNDYDQIMEFIRSLSSGLSGIRVS